MLTGDLVRATIKRSTVEPRFVDPDDPRLVALARALGELFQAHVGRARGELRAALHAHETSGRDPRDDAGRVRLERGLAKLLEDRSTFERASGLDPEEARALVFERAARARAAGAFERGRVLAEVASELASRARSAPSLDEAAGDTEPAAMPTAIAGEDVERALEADRKVHERLLEFEPIEPRPLLVRYNVGLVQAILLRATTVRLALEVRPARVRHLLRALKFRGLLFRAQRLPKGLGRDAGARLGIELDGPLSLFGPSTKYGLGLAEIVPAVLLCERFELEAELAWGRARVAKRFTLTDAAGTREGRAWLRSPMPDPGAAPPPELEALARRFEAIAPGWRATTAVPVLALGEGAERQAFVPDLAFEHRDTGRVGWLELVANARRESLERRLELLRKAAPPGLVVAIAKNLVRELDPAALPDSVVLFRAMPDAREVLARLEAGAAAGKGTGD